MELQDIINKIDIWQEWHDNYCYFVPKFIESAKTCESWQEWDKDLFYEFLNGEETNVYLPLDWDILRTRRKTE